MRLFQFYMHYDGIVNGNSTISFIFSIETEPKNIEWNVYGYQWCDKMSDQIEIRARMITKDTRLANK